MMWDKHVLSNVRSHVEVCYSTINDVAILIYIGISDYSDGKFRKISDNLWSSERDKRVLYIYLYYS